MLRKAPGTDLPSVVRLGVSAASAVCIKHVLYNNFQTEVWVNIKNQPNKSDFGL